MGTTKKIYKVYGCDGHRQKVSFGTSDYWDFSTEGKTRKINILREDVTGTNDYVIIEIERDTAAECDAEFDVQLSDGVFENARIGSVDVLK